MSLNDFEIAILKVMHSRRLYGAKHIRLERVMKSGFMPHQYGDAKKAIYSLIKKSFVVYAKKSKNAIQLNKELLSEIQEIIRH